MNRKLLIFVHGLFGANLAQCFSGSSKTLYLTPWSLLKTQLGLPSGHQSLTRDLRIESSDEVENTGTISPNSLQTQFCQSFIHWAKGLSNDKKIQVEFFLWDWRRSIKENSDKFKQYVLQLELDNDRQAVLVSYSTGSLVAWPAVCDMPHLFSGWLNVGGAIGSGNFMLNMLQRGWCYGPLTIIDPETLCAFAGCFNFFPAAGEPTGSDSGQHQFLNQNTGSPCFIDLYDPLNWEESNLGIFALRKNQGQEVTEKDRQLLSNHLAQSKSFRENYFVREGVESFDDAAFLSLNKAQYDHLSIVCYGADNNQYTHCGWYCQNTNGQLSLTNSALKGPGDGTIMNWAWRFIPGGLSPTEVTTSTPHIKLMNDSKVLKILTQMLQI